MTKHSRGNIVCLTSLAVTRAAASKQQQDSVKYQQQHMFPKSSEKIDRKRWTRYVGR